MADIVVTAASVLPSALAIIKSGIAGATITQGQTLYIDTAASNVLKLADSDTSTATAVVAGISLNAASTGQRVEFVESDPSFTPGGASLLAGDDIWLSDTAGGITKTKSDLEALDTVVHLGVMLTTTTMNLKIVQGGVIA